MKLELIDKVIRESLEHGNEVTDKPNFSEEQIELLTETMKAALEEYHRQINE